MRTCTSPSRRRDDRGITLILFALAIGALAAVTAVVLGTSNGYSAVRNSQNAADAASLAATSQLHEVYTEGADPASVSTVAESVAEDNGADDGSVLCEIVKVGYAIGHSDTDVIGPCTASNVQHAEAFGVRVTLEESRPVPMGAFVGDETITADAVAASTMQPVREGAAPFMVCANATGHDVPLLHSLNSPWETNEAAVGTSVVIWGNDMKNGGRDCGNPSSSWRGWVDFGTVFSLPSSDYHDDAGWWEVRTGNASGRLPRLLSGDDVCGDGSNDQDSLTLIDCTIALPICTHGNGEGGTNFKLHCVRLGAFRIDYNSKGGGSTGPPPCPGTSNDLICAEFLGSAVASGGRTVVAEPYRQEVVAIRLVE